MRRVHLRRVCACAAGKQTPFPVCPVGNALFFCLRCAPVGPPLRRGGAGRMKPVAGGVQPTSIRFAEQPSDGDFQGLRPGAYAPEGAGDGGALAGGDDADDELDRGMFGDGNSRPSEPPAVSPEEAWRGAAIIKNCLRPRAAPWAPQRRRAFCLPSGCCSSHASSRSMFSPPGAVRPRRHLPICGRGAPMAAASLACDPYSWVAARRRLSNFGSCCFMCGVADNDPGNL